MSTNNNLKEGSAEVKRTKVLKVKQYKVRKIVVHPSMLSYVGNKPSCMGLCAGSENKRDFFLAPLGHFTEILQIEEDILLLVSNRKKMKHEHTGEVTARKQPLAFQELTLKFSSREERDDWMQVIIAECDKVYLEGLIDTSLHFAGNFVEAANVEIWSSILLGDESLRRAYIAPAGSDQIEYVRLVLDEVIIWLQMLLGVKKLLPVHKKVFVALLSLMLQDAAARALLLLVRPAPGFLLDYANDTASGHYGVAGAADEAPVEVDVQTVKNQVAAARDFVRDIKEAVQSSGWKDSRAFLAIIDHPAMPLRANPSVDYVEVPTSPVDELAWLDRCGSLGSKFTWEMMKNAMRDTPYLAYHFVKKEIQGKVDDQRVRKVLMLVERVPQEQRNIVFAADGVAKRVRQHFRALVEYCKFREVWKVFYVDHARSSVFFEALHIHLWSRITMTDDPLLRGIFLPTSVSSTTPALKYADVLSIEMVSNGEAEFLRSLDINVVAAAPEEALRARVSNVHHKASVFFRRIALKRIEQWTKAIAGVTVLTAAEAPIFVNLFIAAAKSAVVRAVLWLILPAPGAFQEGTSVTAGNPGSLALCDQFISSLLNLAKPSSRLERFLSFLIVAEHPLAGAVYTPSNTSPLHIVMGPVAASTDAYAKEMTWPEEMVWMDNYPQQNWLLSSEELRLLLNDTPYFSLQMLMRKLHQDANNPLRWLTLLRSLPHDIMVTRFEADVNMCAVNGTHQFGSCAVKMAAHFLTFIDSRRVTELWKLFQTNYLNSSTEFVEQAQNRLLLVLEHQRESPGNSPINRSGFCQLMVLLDTATTATVATLQVTFGTLLPMAVWTNAALGDHMWRILLSLYRLDGDNASNGAPVAAASALQFKRNLDAFRQYLDHLAVWSAGFCGLGSPAGTAGGVFAELLSSCLDNAVLRTFMVVLKPRHCAAFASQDAESAAATERLSSMLIALNQQKNDRYLLYLLHELNHPGTKREEDGTVTFQECTWAVESDWLWATQRTLTLVFDTEDFALLADPAYLLFRYVSRNFRESGEADVHRRVNLVQNAFPDIMDITFPAHDNYLPCRDDLIDQVCTPVEGPHFKHLSTYTLFYEMWKIVMSRLTNPSLDVSFVQSATYATWLLVKAHENPHLSKLLLPLESDLYWQEMTYLVAVQRHAIITIARGGHFQLSRLYRSIVIPEEATVSPDDISAHNLLIDRMEIWVHSILGGKKHYLDGADAELFKEFFIAATADTAMRAFLVTFLPSPSTVTEFMRSPSCTTASPLGEGEDPTPAEYQAASIRLVRLLAQTFRKENWRQYRSFLTVLRHPMRSPGKINESEPLWADESAWIRERLTVNSALLSWQDLEHLMADTPYIFLLLLTKAMPTVEQQQSAVNDIPAKYLMAKFTALDNYLPWSTQQNASASVPVEGTHFKHHITNALFHEMWKISMSRLASPPLDVGFVESVTYGIWMLVHSNENPALSKLLLPLESDTQWQKLTYQVAIQRHAIVTIARGGQFQLSRLYRSLAIPPGLSVTDNDIGAHDLLVDRIVMWAECLQYGIHQRHCLEDADGQLFVELLAAAAADVVMRAFLVTFLPTATVISNFSQSAQHSPTSAFESFATEYRAASILFVKLLAQNFRRDSWRQYRAFLSVLHHPMRDAGSANETEPLWVDESEWITQRLQFEPTLLSWQELEFVITDTPCIYLLLVTKAVPTINQQRVVMHNIPAKYLTEKFVAADNYLPIRDSQSVRRGEPVDGPHFKFLLYDALFHASWKVVMPRLASSSLDLGFAQAVVRAMWLLVNSSDSPELSKMFLPQESDLQWQKLTYLVTVQRHAIISIARSGQLELFRLYRSFVVQDDLAVYPDDISAHHQLIDRIIRWVHSLLGGKRHHLEEADAPLFVELLAAAAADVVMRAFLLTFLPAPSVSTDFMQSAEFSQEFLFSSSENGGGCVAACVRIIKFLAQTFRSDKWRQYRSFLTLLDHPMRDAGSANETEPLWADESKWIEQRLQLEPTLVSWQELGYIASSAPYIHLLLTSKAVSSVEEKKATLMQIPAPYLAEKFNGHSSDADTSALCARHFIAMCLHEATSEVALEVFQERGMISDAFFEALLSEAVSDSTCPRLLQAFHLVQRILYAGENEVYLCGGTVWDIEVLHNIPNISSVLITFLWDISQRENFRRDEKIIGNLILLVFQLESYSSDNVIAQAAVLANKHMRQDANFADMLFDMVEALNFPKWFSRLCWNFNVHFGMTAATSVREPEVGLDAEYATVGQDCPPSGDYDSHNPAGDIMLDPTIPLTKHKLTMSIVGFFNLCLEFKPEALCEFVAGLGTGRPFFSFFLHQNESLTEQVLLSLTSILGIKQGSVLYARVQERFLFYDNDHLTPAAVRTLGLRTSNTVSASLCLTDSEFTDLLTVAMYMHDLHNLPARFENAVISMIADQERREMVVKFMKWMLQFFVTPDIASESNPLNTKANERIKWKNCEKFKKVSFEDLIECANEATVASHLLRGAARSNSYVTLERLFEHYIRNSSPTGWTVLFRGSKTIAYFIKYVDVEDLNLAFAKFYEMNDKNNCFKHHLFKVRKLLTEPIVSAKDLVQLTASSSSFDSKNAEGFFAQLLRKASNLPAHQVDLKMVYFLTASWMKISKEKVLFPLPPRNAQIITLLTVASWAKSLLVKKDKSMGKALIAQVGTGEGKSLIIAMMAIYFVVVLKKRVHILENNPGLLDKDVDTMTPLFAEFGIKTHHEGVGADSKPTLTWTTTEKQNKKNCGSEFCKFGVTYCLRRNLERYYQESIMAEDFSPLANTVLIVDEVDDLIVDENPNQPYAAQDCEQQTFQAACREAQVEFDLAELDGGYFDVGEFANGDFVRETAANAYLKAKSMVLGLDYAIVGGKYVILQNGEPVELYDYSLECLTFLNHGLAPKFFSTYYVQSVPYMLSQYDCITGFSGSLGSPSERAFLAQEYKAWSFDTPSFLNTCTNVYKVPPALMDDAQDPGVPAVHVYDTVDEQVDKIVEMCLRLHLKVPVLVIAKSADEAIAIEAKVKEAMAAQPNGPPVVEGTKHKYVQLFRQYKLGSMTIDKENWGHMVRRATSRGPEEDRYCITVTDPFGGRGHDFDVHDDEVNRLGGLAVIMTSIPASEREWRQWKGRTARKDNRGQYAVVLNNTTSPVLNAKDILVDYALRRENQDAIPNLYKEGLIDKLLSLQDENQFEKLRELEKDIVTGRRLNRLCDVYYNVYGAMQENNWPESDEDVKLRKLLTEPLTVGLSITALFKDLHLTEHDETTIVFDPPDTKSSAFWNESYTTEWQRLNSEVGQIQDANPAEVASAATPPPPPIQNWNDNPIHSPASTPRSPSMPPQTTAALSSTPPPPSTPALPATKARERPPPPPARPLFVAQRNPSTPNPLDNTTRRPRSSAKLNSAGEQQGKQKAAGPQRLAAVEVNPPAQQQDELPTSSSRSTRKKSSKVVASSRDVPNDEEMELTYEQAYAPSNLQSTLPGMISMFENTDFGAATEAEEFTGQEQLQQPQRSTPAFTPPPSGRSAAFDVDALSSLAIDLHADDEEPVQNVISPRRKVRPPPPPPPPLPKGSVEIQSADLNGLSLVNAAAVHEPPPVPKKRQQRERAPKVIIPVRERVRASDAAVGIHGTLATSQTNLHGAGAGAGTIAANIGGASEQSSSTVAANNSGTNETSGVKAMNLASGAAHAREVRALNELCVGDTKKLTNPMNVALKEQLLSVNSKGDPLTVAVYDTTGRNAGNGVAGLAVSGAVTVTSTAYTLLFEVKVTPEDYQYNMLLYGKKKLEAKWKGATLLSAPVLFKPAPKLRPRGAYAFHNAANDKKIPAGGFVTFSSVDDPRSTPERPVFPAVQVPYTGGNVALPPSLPADCVVTVSPEIPGYSTEYSEKFVLFGGETIAEETMKMMLSETNLVEGEWRVVLSWGEHPQDLDLYCVTNFEPRTIYFRDKNTGGKKDESMGKIELDIDVRYGYGPETITFTPNPTKRYRFFVRNFTGNAVCTLANSGAKIVVNKDRGRPVQFEVPTDIVVGDDDDIARTWHVFDLFENTLMPVNEVVQKDLRAVWI